MVKKFTFILILFFSFSCLNEKRQSEMILQHFISKKVDLLRNYTMESAVALWNFHVSGDEGDYQKVIDLELDFNKANQNTTDHFSPDRLSTLTQKVFTNEQDFQLLEKLKNSGAITDTMLSRQLTVMYYAYMGPQVEAERYKKILDAEIKLWQAFSVTTLEVDGKEYGLSQVDSIRKNTSDNVFLKKLYNAFREKGKLISGEIIAVVKMRNEFARNFGYKDYYQLSLGVKEQTPEKVKVLLDEIEFKTRNQFFEAKRVIDKLLAKRFNISTAELGPWHYNEERTSYLPAKFSEKIDTLFKRVDPIQKTSEFFDGIGLPVLDVIEKSDLRYRPKKLSSTFMLNVDFKNDLRLFASIRNDLDGMQKMMHICGHTSQYKAIPDNLPYLLKAPNPIVAEGVASFFENLPTNFSWLNEEFNLDSTASKQYILICQHLFQVDRLFRCRKYMVMAEFEREIYRDPDQNLGELWVQLSKKYLGIDLSGEKSQYDWATNKYVNNLSCTVQNYLLADVFAAQLQHTIEKEVLHDKQLKFQNNKAIGQFLVSHLYKYGDVLPWEQLVEKATGEPLNPAYFLDYLLEGSVKDQKK